MHINPDVPAPTARVSAIIINDPYPRVRESFVRALIIGSIVSLCYPASEVAGRMKYGCLRERPAVTRELTWTICYSVRYTATRERTSPDMISHDLLKRLASSVKHYCRRRHARISSRTIHLILSFSELRVSARCATSELSIRRINSVL